RLLNSDVNYLYKFFHVVHQHSQILRNHEIKHSPQNSRTILHRLNSYSDSQRFKEFNFLFFDFS
ncbi:hypothetical protein MIMGU_mgv1a019542mg, partial [Erythranthe guttata]